MIGFNSTAGVQIVGTSSTDATDALVEGNFIGTDASATQDLGNATAVQIFNAAGNTIGGTTAGASTPAANVIGFNTDAGIAILSGIGNAVNGNIYDGTNGTLVTPSVAANDIGVGVGANGNLPPPLLLSASLSSGGTLSLALSGKVGADTTLDVYLYGTTKRTFLGEATIASGHVSGSLPGTVSGVSVGNSQIVATQSVAADGTSAFSAPLTVQSQTTVTNTNDSGPGSLRDALAGASGGSTIRFAIPTTDPNYGAATGHFTINLMSTLSVTIGLTIDGTTELTPQQAPAIVLADGGGVANGLDLTANGTELEGIQFTGFTGSDVLMESGSNTLGGTATGQGNVFATTGGTGVSITGASNLLEGNFIGTDAEGNNLGGGLGAVIAGAGARNNTVGGTAAGALNTFAFNGSDADHGVLTVNIGTGNEILTNLFFKNTGTTTATSGIDLTNGGNDVDRLPAPVITSATSSGSGSTTITLDVTGMAAGTYQLDVFASAPGDTPTAGQVDAHVALGTVSVTIHTGDTSETAPVNKALSGGQQVTATWTVVAPAPSGLTAGDTSVFSATAAVPQPFVVTTTDPSASTPGSLGFEINAVNSDDSNTGADTIVFQLSPGSAVNGLWTIAPNSDLVITHPLILDGTTQSGYTGTPVIVIDAHLETGAALKLAGGSTGSTIRGLDVINAPGAGLDIESNTNTVQFNDFGVMPDGKTMAPNAQGILVNSTGNTVGGTAPGAGNVVAFNGGIGIDVTAATAAVNTIRGNLIYSNTGTALSTTSTVPPPSLTAALSSGGTTTVDGVGGPSGATFDFYATSGSLGPAALYLGRDTSFPAHLSASVPTGASIVATLTSAGGDTSAFSSSVSVSNPFAVQNTNDGGVGSLRQVILTANAAGVPVTIFFNFSSGTAPFTIKLNSALPEIDVPVTIDATGIETTPGVPAVVIDGQGLTGDGLKLGTTGVGSAGSVIKGLDIIDFAGNGMYILSNSNLVADNDIGLNLQGTAAPTTVGIAITGSNNTVGGNSAAAANSIAFNNDGVDVNAGNGNTVRANAIYKNTVHDLNVASTANDGIKAPTSLAYTSVANLTTIDYTIAGTAGQTYSLDFYANSGSNGPAAVYLGSSSAKIPASASSLTSFATFNFTTPLMNGQMVTATVTATDGSTSNFASTAGFTDPFQVITGADNVVGSLRQAILDADAAGGNPTISFALALQVVPISSLPTIVKQVNIDATTFAGFNPSTSNIVEILGSTSNTTVGGDGLTLGAGSDNSTIRGLSIGDFLSGAGIRVASNGDQVLGDYLGVFPGATPTSIPNAQGVYVSGSQNTIGGTTAGAADVIADNNGPGVTVDSGIGDLISGNAIFDNNQGIVLQNGGNQTLGSSPPASPPPPILTSASTTGSQISISGQLTGFVATAAITVEFFASQSGDLTVPDQANVYLGSLTVPAGETSFSVSNLAASVGQGQAITATASAAGLGTSPMAANIQAVSPFMVTTTKDTVVVGGLRVPAVGSLRQAILSAIQTPGSPIQFDIPTTDLGYIAATGTWTITLDAPLPTITKPVVIDGTTQPSYYNEAAINPTNPAPVILIDGDDVVGDGLTLAPGSDGSVIKGLAIFGFNSREGIYIQSDNNSGAGIDIQSNDNTLAADWLGKYPTAGSVLGSSNAIGLAIEGGSNNTIGLGDVLTIAPPDNSLSPITVSGLDLISGNSGDGIQITPAVSGSAASGNLIQDTFIGTDAAGATALGNDGYGIEIDNGLNNTIGGATIDTLVLVSGNMSGGILISGDPSVGDPPRERQSDPELVHRHQPRRDPVADQDGPRHRDRQLDGEHDRRHDQRHGRRDQGAARQPDLG